MTAELGTILGIRVFVVLSVVCVAWRMGRVEGWLSGVEQSIEWLHAEIDRLREDSSDYIPSPPGHLCVMVRHSREACPRAGGERESSSR